jgi:hypothetical protein
VYQEFAIAVITSICELLWNGPIDRHGTDDESVPLHVIPDDAGLAVSLAVVLVQWFTRGVVRLTLS